MKNSEQWLHGATGWRVISEKLRQMQEQPAHKELLVEEFREVLMQWVNTLCTW
jgi:hypothetical protein